MKRLSNNIFFILLFTFTGCEKNPMDEQKNYVPGEVLVWFEDSVTATIAQTLITDLELEFRLLRVYSYFKWGVVMVPIGREQYWVDEFPKHEIVRYAQLNHYLTQREWESRE